MSDVELRRFACVFALLPDANLAIMDTARPYARKCTRYLTCCITDYESLISVWHAWRISRASREGGRPALAIPLWGSTF